MNGDSRRLSIVGMIKEKRKEETTHITDDNKL
jgi:hypothetical protein